jgi:GAF domain-containing protein
MAGTGRENDDPSGDDRRLTALARTGLSPAADDRMERVCRLVARLLDVPVALVSLVDDRRQFFPGAHGLDGDLADARQTPLSQSVCRDVVATQSFVRIDDMANDERYDCHPARHELGVGAYLGVPLVDGSGHVLGSLCAISPDARPWSDDDVALMLDLAVGASADLRARIAMSIANEARIETSAAHERMRVLLQAADALSSTLDPDASVSRMLDAIVPSMARWAAVYLVPTAGTDAQIMVRHSDPSLDSVLLDFAATPRDDEYDPPIVRAIIQGDAPYVSTPASMRPNMPPDLAKILEQLGLGAGLAVPIVAQSGILGALLLVGNADAPPFPMSEIQVAIDLGARAGMAMENARLYKRQREVALTLQRSLLPPLHRIDGIELAAVYRPASSGVEVGGDWYDAVAMPSGAVCLSIGDVTGHSTAATAVMGKLRGALHSRALDGLSPMHMLAKLDRDAPALLDDHLATCLVGCLERTGDQLGFAWSSAGHLPPAVICADGRVEMLEVRNDVLIGVMAAPQRQEHQVVLEAGSRLVFYTDGLVERRDQPLDAGIGQLRTVLGTLDPRLSPAEWCEAIVNAMAPDGSDDVAVLVVVPVA